MNKAELIDTISTGLPNISKADIQQVVDLLPRAIIAALKVGEEVRYSGFGIFSRQDRPATTGRNPRTGEPVQIAAKRVCKFKPAAGLNAALAAE